MCKIENDKVQSIFKQPERVIEQLINTILYDEAEDFSNQLKSAALKAVVSRKLPPISIGRDATESMVKIPKNIFRN